MNLRPHRREEANIDLTPLIDVVFLLLIFFMVTTTFNREAELKIELPEASAKPEQQQQDILEIVIDADGRYFVNRQAVINTQIETLKRALQEAADGRTNPPLVITADARTHYQAVITAMDAAAQLGFTRLAITTKQDQHKE